MRARPTLMGRVVACLVSVSMTCSIAPVTAFATDAAEEEDASLTQAEDLPTDEGLAGQGTAPEEGTFDSALPPDREPLVSTAPDGVSVSLSPDESGFAAQEGEEDAAQGDEEGSLTAMAVADDVDPQDAPHVFEVTGTAHQTEARKLLGLVNQARSAKDIYGLVWDSELEKTALQRAAEISLYFSHTRPDGSVCFSIWPGDFYYAAAENIAWGQANATHVNDSWTNSPGHYANMLNTSVTTFAAACFEDADGGLCWVECFSTGDGTGMAGTAVDGSINRSISATLATVESLDLSFARDAEDGIMLMKGETEDLGSQLRVNGTTALAASSLTWSSSDPKVVKVSEKGLVTGAGCGDAVVTATSKTDPSLTASVEVMVREDVAVFEIAAVEDQTYRGKPLMPAPLVKVGSKTLVEGADYTLAYEDNDRVGEARIVIAGAGDYVGTRSVAFTIIENVPAWERLAGKDALATGAAVVAAGEAFPAGRGGTVLIATASGYWDALAASGLAGALDAPVLITAGGSLSPETEAAIRRLAPERALVLGGRAAVSDDCLAQVRAIVPVTERVAGADAPATAVSIFRRGTGWGDTCVVATSSGYWDALSVAPYAWAEKAPIFLTGAGNRLTDETVEAIRGGGFAEVVVVGGRAVVSGDVEGQLDGMDVVRLKGNDAIATSGEIARWEVARGMVVDGMAVATAGGYWDALTGAALCGKLGSVLVLVSGSDTRAFDAVYDRNLVSHGYVFGGRAAVSDDTWRYVTTK